MRIFFSWWSDMASVNGIRKIISHAAFAAVSASLTGGTASDKYMLYSASVAALIPLA